MNIIDLRSDTVTHPTAEMRKAMAEAEVGDDVYGEDPTINELENRCADLAGKEAGLFVSSGSMGNLVALLSHLQGGDSAIIGATSHISLWEQGGIASLVGAFPQAINNLAGGVLPLDEIRAHIGATDVHVSPTKLICLENTWNGAVLELDYMRQVRKLADDHGLKLHLDGARIFNACVAKKLPLKQYAETVDSVQFCFSKGLCAPVGSMLVGDERFIAAARRHRKLVGGGMRQAGILAAACMVALDEMIDRLEEDHRNAMSLSERVGQISGLKITTPVGTPTNMVFFDTKQPQHRAEFVAALKQKGVLVGVEGRLGIRAVTHYGIEPQHIKDASERIARVVSEQMFAGV